MIPVNSSLFVLFTFIVFLVSVGVLCENPLSSYEVIFGWNRIDFQFESTNVRNGMISTKQFIPENNVVTGVKVYGARIYLTVPRWRPGVPATLVYVPYNASSDIDANESANGPLLIPYPSWAMNEIGNCKALQNVQSMEIDRFHRLWAIDIGRINIFDPNPISKCPPKLVVIDLNSSQVVSTHEFPSDVVSQNNFLNDLVVACDAKDEKACWAYITDALEARIIVFNYAEDKSWFVTHPTMQADKDASTVSILGFNSTFSVNVDGIALSQMDAGFDRLYYCPLSSYSIYSVSTQTLKTAGNAYKLNDNSVRNHGTKTSQSDGLVIDFNGVMFYGLLEGNSISFWNTSYGTMNDTNQDLLVKSDIDLQWVDTLALDTQGYLYAVTNRLQRFKPNSYDPTEVNFRVIRTYIGSKSYMYSKKEKVDFVQEVLLPGPASRSKYAVTEYYQTNETSSEAYRILPRSSVWMLPSLFSFSIVIFIFSN